MAVKGSLEYQGLEHVLRADVAAQGGGRLTLRHGAHYAALYLDEAGLHVIQPDLLDADLLAEALVVRGMLDPEALTRARGARLSGTRLLERLLAEGTLREADFMEVLVAEVEDTVLDLLLWDQGVYRFEREPYEAGSFGLLGRISVDPTAVAERALARRDARRAMAARVGRHGLLFHAVTGDIPIDLDERDRSAQIYARLDGRSTVHEIALGMGISRFEVLQSIARLIDVGIARPAAPEELSAAAAERARAGHRPLARALVLQWAEAAPDDPAPLRKLASLGKEAGDKTAEIEALCTLGNLHIERGESGEALEVFRQAMHRAPADDVVLAGLRLAAEAAGDGNALAEGTLLTAQCRLDEGETGAALRLLEPLLESDPLNMAVHLLRARALVQSENRTEFFEQAEVVGNVLGSQGCRSSTDREVVEFFRETITHLAPDRGDLLERFRAIYDSRSRARRSVAIVLALLLIVGGAGVYLWPASAASLLARAQAAVAAGDADLARQTLTELRGRFPDEPEAEEALALEASLLAPSTAPKRRTAKTAGLRASVEPLLPALEAALPRLPDPAAQGAVRAVLEPLASANVTSLTKALLGPVEGALAEHTTRLHAAAMQRIEVLARTSGATERHHGDGAALRAFLDEATRLRDPTWLAELKASSQLLFGVAKLCGKTALIRKAQELGRSSVALEKAAVYFDKHAPHLHRTLGSEELTEAERRCREDAPKLMVGGQIDQADALYAHLGALLERYATNEIYSGLLEEARARQVPHLIEDRRGQIADIRARLAKAQQAEDTGDLVSAVALYSALMREYWLIRFESICTLPLRVVSVPTGAHVVQDGVEVGHTPCVVRYPWGSQTSIRVEAPGFEASTQALRTAEEAPPSQLVVRLAPRTRWRHAVAAKIGVRPLDVDGHALLVDRRGHVTLHDSRTGAPRWTHDGSSLEGVRARPAHVDGVVYLARVDGRVLFLDAAKGTPLGHVSVGRPVGDVGVHGDTAAVATTRDELVVLRQRAIAFRVPLGAVPTAGVVGGHGAYWVGTADGTVLRIDLELRRAEPLRATRGTAPVAALTATADGILVTTSDGVLLALDPDGATRWRRAGLGDLTGAPVRAGAIVAVSDRTGVLHVLAAADGTPRATQEIGGRTRGGVLASGTTLLAVRRDGHLWAYDTVTQAVLVDADIEARSEFPPAVLAGGDVVLPIGGSNLGVIPVPRVPSGAR